VTAATLGQHERAREFAERALRARPNEFGTAYNCACAFAKMGERDRALELLQQAVRFGRGNLGWIEHDPDLDALRGDPRFEALVAGLGAGSGTQGDDA